MFFYTGQFESTKSPDITGVIYMYNRVKNETQYVLFVYTGNHKKGTRFFFKIKNDECYDKNDKSIKMKFTVKEKTLSGSIKGNYEVDGDFGTYKFKETKLETIETLVKIVFDDYFAK